MYNHFIKCKKLRLKFRIYVYCNNSKKREIHAFSVLVIINFLRLIYKICLFLILVNVFKYVREFINNFIEY